MSVLVRQFPNYEPVLLGYRLAPQAKLYFGGVPPNSPTGYQRTMVRYFGDSLSVPFIGRRYGFTIFLGSTPGPNPSG